MQRWWRVSPRPTCCASRSTPGGRIRSGCTWRTSATPWWATPRTRAAAAGASRRRSGGRRSSSKRWRRASCCTPPASNGTHHGTTVLLEVGGGRKVLGFTVDEVVDLLALSAEALDRRQALPGIDPTLVRAVGRRAGQLFVVLDTDALLTPILSS